MSVSRWAASRFLILLHISAAAKPVADIHLVTSTLHGMKSSGFVLKVKVMTAYKKVLMLAHSSLFSGFSTQMPGCFPLWSSIAVQFSSRTSHK